MWYDWGMNKRGSKAGGGRKIYVRCGIPHVCFAGALWAPGNKDTSKIWLFPSIDSVELLQETVTIAGKRTRAVQVTVLGPKQSSKPVREYWYETEIGGGKARKARAASAMPKPSRPSPKAAKKSSKTVGRNRSDGCEEVAREVQKSGGSWTADDERAHRAKLHAQPRAFWKRGTK